MTPHLARIARWTVVLASAVLVGGLAPARPVLAGDPAPPAPSVPTGTAFTSAEDAAKALVEACEKNDDKALVALLGKDSDDLVANGADPKVAKERKSLAKSAKAKLACVPSKDDPARVEVQVGDDGWPLPIPLVKGADGKWRFDADGGREELLRRRIGGNELAAIDVCRQYIDAQVVYASKDRDGDRVREYAQLLRSTPGQKDGLWWPYDASKGEEPSPFDDLVTPYKEYLTEGGKSAPFAGYFYKILTAQGPHAPGGAHSYVINGNMIAGFALVAVPAEYGDSGIMTLIVSNHGKVFEKDLGEKGLEIVKGMEQFDPDSTWTEVKADHAPEAPK